MISVDIFSFMNIKYKEHHPTKYRLLKSQNLQFKLREPRQTILKALRYINSNGRWHKMNWNGSLHQNSEISQKLMI
jgi:hypothetical protein